MKLIYPTESEIIDFFINHTGYIDVMRISELLVAPSHNNVQDQEWKHVYKILHKLKSEGYLLIQNEGEDIYHEKFSSTPDRIERFLEKKAKTKNFYNNKNQNKNGEVEFIYSSNNGLYLIGDNEFLFGIKFSGASQQSIYIYNDHSTIDSIALIKNVTEFDQVNFKIKYDGTSRVRCPSIGEIVLIRNKNNKYALIKIENIQMESRGDKNDKVTFSFKILEDEYSDLIAEEKQVETKTKEETEIPNALKVLVEEIDNIYNLADQELLEARKLEEIESKIRTEISSYLSTNNNEILNLKFKKIVGGFRNTLKSGFHNRKTAESKLQSLRELIVEILDVSLPSKTIREVYFSKGTPFNAVKALREILNSAKTDIWVEDNFLHPDTISIIEPYLKTGKVSIKFLTKKGHCNFKSFCVDAKKLKSQYSAITIEAKENSFCHDRYIIIDKNTVYHSGHSFHDLGNKASQINKVEDEINKNQIISDFNEWWTNGNDIFELTA